MTPTATPTLLEPVELRGGMRLANRVVMAPMTRARAASGDVPTELMATYYAQRATAGLVVTEGVTVSPEGKGYSDTPGVFTDEQQAGWAQVAERVHRVEGSRVFLQLWHVGRLSHPEVNGLVPVGPSARRPPRARVWLRRPDGWQGLVDVAEPREMSRDDIARTVADHAAAARRALDAGMDGVEIHGANGYLVDQFLRSTTNHRTDAYGGDATARLRFLREVVEAVVDVAGPGRTGIRLSPFVEYGDTTDPEIGATLAEAAAWLDGVGTAYLHLAQIENQHLHRESPQGALDTRIRADVRAAFTGPLVLAGEQDGDSAERAVASGEADLVAFGRSFIANPDLVDRLRRRAPLAPTDRTTWYGGGAAGYVDHPLLDGTPAPG